MRWSAYLELLTKHARAWLCVAGLFALTSCGGGNEGVTAMQVPNLPAVWGSLSVNETASLSTPQCTGATVYLRLQSDPPPFPHGVVEKAALVLAGRTVALDSPTLVAGPNGDAFMTATVCLTASEANSPLEGLVRLTFPDVTTVDIRTPPAHLIPQKVAPPPPPSGSMHVLIDYVPNFTPDLPPVAGVTPFSFPVLFVSPPHGTEFLGSAPPYTVQVQLFGYPARVQTVPTFAEKADIRKSYAFEVPAAFIASPSYACGSGTHVSEVRVTDRNGLQLSRTFELCQSQYLEITADLVLP